jgi:hypothetical protein
MKRLVVILAVLVSLFATSSAAFAQQYEFKLGFKALADQIPEVVGQPLENEHWGPNGDSLQRTTTGLMAWRKADNWTAFTNGHMTWLNGPAGLQSRLNGQRFCWEGDANRAQCAGRESSDLVDPAPAPPAPPAPAPAPAPAPTPAPVPPAPTPAPAPAPAPARAALSWSIDTPPDGAAVPARNFTIRGWVADPAAGDRAWNGIDEFQVYVDGEREAGGKRINVTSVNRISRPDVAEATGKPAFQNSGFSLTVTMEGVNGGAHVLYVYAHSSVSGWDYRTINLTLGPYLEELNLRASDLPVGYHQVLSRWQGSVHVTVFETNEFKNGPAIVESDLMGFKTAAEARAFVEAFSVKDSVAVPVSVIGASAARGFEVAEPLSAGSPWIGYKMVVYSVGNVVGFVMVFGYADVSWISHAVGVADRIASRIAGQPVPGGPGFQRVGQ